MFHDRFEEFLGEGIFNVDGKAWKVQRKTSSHMFNAKTLNEHMHPVCYVLAAALTPPGVGP